MAYPGPLTPVPRRTVSLPVTRPSGPDPQIEILYTLSSVRIISFTTATSASSPGSNKDTLGLEDEVGTLPWTSRFERTLAVGPLRIYRAPGSVAFLSCNSALRPILPKSQAWCVDDESSKFVLQIKRPQYWRIEIPNGGVDDKLRSEELKDVLGKVLMFEKTACPFQRSFTIELPKAPETPVKKRPWKPVERRKSESPLGRHSESTTSYLGVHEANSSAKRSPPLRSSARLSCGDVTTPESKFKPSVIDEGTQTPPITGLKLQTLLEEPLAYGNQSNGEISPSPAPRSSLATSLLGSVTGEASLGEPSGLQEDSDSCRDFMDDTNITSRNSQQPASQQLPSELDPPKAPEVVKNRSRSITAPPVLSLVTSPPSKHKSESPLRRQKSTESDSSDSLSGASFYSTQSWHSPLAPPSPPISPTNTNSYPYPHDNITLPKRPQPMREVSEITVNPEIPQTWEMNGHSYTAETSSPSKPPALVSDVGDKSDEEHAEAVTPPRVRPMVRHRATTSSNLRRRTLSPLPPAVNLFSPQRHLWRLQTARHLPTAIIKTCEVLLSPPSHLINLMINIASKIAAGEWRGFLSGHGEAVHWDFTEDEYRSDGWDEDDYGISLTGTSRPRAKSSSASSSATTMDFGGSWEID